MRRLRIVPVAVLCFVGILTAPPPAEAHPNTCAGQGVIQTSYGLGHPVLYPAHWVNFYMGIVVGTCTDPGPWGSGGLSMTGTLTGWCGLATGQGVTNDGHTFWMQWVGEEWVMGLGAFPEQPTIHLPFIPTDSAMIGAGDMTPDPFTGSCFNGTMTRLFMTGTWSAPVHSNPPPPNYPPYAPTQLSPVVNHEFAPADTQQFTIQTSDPEGDSYRGRIRVRDTATNLEVATYFTDQVASGQPATAVAVPPLPAGEYTWTADASDDIAPTSFGSASGARSFTVKALPPFPPQYPSDDCDTGGATYADGFVGGTYYKLRSKGPTAGTTSVCFRAEAGGIGFGGKVTFASPNTSAPGTPTLDANGGACPTMSGNALPPPHPLVSGSLGDPGDPSTYVPFTADVFASADRAALCVTVGTTGQRLIVPMPQAGSPPSVLWEQDDVLPHTPTPTDNPSPVSGTCQASTTGTKTEHANVVTALETVWLHTWQESASKTHVCLRAQGTATTGGRFTIDSTGSGVPTPVTTTSTTDTTPCALRVAGIDSPTTVDLRRSTNLTDTSGVSFCVIVGTTKVRVTVGATGSAGVPQTTWTPD